MMALLLATALDVAVLGDVLCAEGRGLPRAELAAIAQVARNRARRGALAVELRRPGQFARGCPRRLRSRYEAVARAFLAGRLVAPRWARRAVAFVAPHRLAAVGARWRRRGLRLIHGTGTVHLFWRRS